MKVNEQLRRISKAAPHFPIQTFLSAGFLVALPFCLFQLYASASFNWIKVAAIMNDHKPVHERFRMNDTEFFYTLYYTFKVDRQQYSVPFEKGFKNREAAEDDLQTALTKKESVFVWYKRTDPSKTSFQDTSSQWQLYLMCVIIMFVLLAYFRWMMLKYYELEQSGGSDKKIK